MNSKNLTLLCVGPAMGSLFHMIGGYSLPFYVVGSTIVLLSVCTTCLIPKKAVHAEVENKLQLQRNRLTVWTVLMVMRMLAKINNISISYI